MRIRTRLLILVLSVLVPSFVAAALAVAYVYKEEQENQANAITEATRAFALLVDNELQAKAGVLRTLANSPSLDSGDLEEFYRHAKSMTPTAGIAVILTDTTGRQLLNTRVPYGEVVPVRRWSNMAELMRHYGSDRTLVSDLFVAPVTQRYDFTVQVPVKLDGDIAYYLVMAINANSLQSLLARQHFPANWLATIVDRKGKVVARSRDAEQYVGKTVRENTRLRLAAKQEDLYESVTLEGAGVKAFFSTVPNVDWKVQVHIPSVEIRRAPLQVAAFLATIMALLLVMGTLAARRVANQAIGPIELLGRNAEGLGHGEELTYQPHGLAEIDSVAQRMAEASRQIRHSKLELEQRVAEAISATERAQSALLKGQKLEALGRLTGGIAHEFNNLLQTLTTALQLAAMTSTQPKVQSLIETCKRTVARATALTGQLGSFGRAQEARLVAVDVAGQVRSAVRLMKGVLPQGTALKVQCDSGLWPVLVEPLQFDLALLNLAINARDAMPAGGTLRIDAQNVELQQPQGKLAVGDYVLITVTDTGTGMAPEVLSKALDPFFTTKMLGQGTGLGLPQAYAFAAQARGTLILNSTPGQGTSVEIYLPRSDTPVSMPAPSPRKQGLDAGAKGTVLFVEDDALVREAVAPALKESGFDVLVAENGDAALAMLENGAAPDVIFSDIVMPGQISGIDLAGIVKQRFPALPVVLATGYTDQQVSIPGVQVLGKPYAIETVVALLAEIAERA
jgi:signal transduction histidine kinase